MILSASEHESSRTEGTSLNGTATMGDVKVERGIEAIR